MKLYELLDVLEESKLKIYDADGYIYFENKKLISEELRNREVQLVKYGMFYLSECIVIYLKIQTEEEVKNV